MYLRLLTFLRRIHVIPPLENVLVRFTGWSLMGTLITRNQRVPYVPTLLLRSVGAKSGDLRDSALFYVKDGDAFIIVGSKGGAPAHPGWVHNLRANPQAWVWADRKRVPVQVQEIATADQEPYWTQAIALWPPYAQYRERAQPRLIPLFRLTPTARA